MQTINLIRGYLFSGSVCLMFGLGMVEEITDANIRANAASNPLLKAVLGISRRAAN